MIPDFEKAKKKGNLKISISENLIKPPNNLCYIIRANGLKYKINNCGKN